MSSIVNKIKEVVHDKKHPHSEPEGTHGPHSSRVANAADPRVDSDRDGSRHVGNTTGTHGDYTRSDNYTTGSSHTAGPHRSDALNKADPRVDSDRDGSRNVGMNQTHNYGGATGTTGITGTTGTTGTYTAGPHRSDALNKADPRVDSDRDGSRNMGMNQTHNYGGTTGITGITGTTGTHHTAGPHRSDALNKADPRVDSDRDRSHNMGLSQDTTHQHHGITGSSAAEGTYGPHGTRAANAMDPTVDSDRDGSNTLGGTRFNGPAPHTAGPHKSDMMNKVDPRVDSNLDGSKTFGGDKTYTQSNTHGKNPLDASQVPPSVLRKHIGEVEIAHDDHAHNRERRNSVATHQENHLMGNVV